MGFLRLILFFLGEFSPEGSLLFDSTGASVTVSFALFFAPTELEFCPGALSACFFPLPRRRLFNFGWFSPSALFWFSPSTFVSALRFPPLTRLTTFFPFLSMNFLIASDPPVLLKSTKMRPSVLRDWIQQSKARDAMIHP